MEFNVKNVVNFLNEDIEKWKGWKGYFADTIGELNNSVVNNDEDGFATFSKIDKTLKTFVAGDDLSWELFYPVEPPEGFVSGDNYAICKDLAELAISANDNRQIKGLEIKDDVDFTEKENIKRKHIISKTLIGKIIVNKTTSTTRMITGINYIKNGIESQGIYYDLIELYHDWYWDIDGEYKIMGLKECGA